MGSSPGSSVASPRGRGARSSSFLSLFYLSILAFRAFTLSIALTSRSRALSFSLLVAISRHPLSPILSHLPGFPEVERANLHWVHKCRSEKRAGEQSGGNGESGVRLET